MMPINHDLDDEIEVIPQPLLLALEAPYSRVILPYLKSRNDGSLCTNCFSFFSKDSRDLALHCPDAIVRVSTYTKTQSIRTIEDLARSIHRGMDDETRKTMVPTVGRQECLYKTNATARLLIAANLTV